MIVTCDYCGRGTDSIKVEVICKDGLYFFCSEICRDGFFYTGGSMREDEEER